MVINCAICGIEKKTYDNLTKCCSHPCRSIFMRRRTAKTCSSCGISFNSRSKFCSSKCYGKTIIGTKKGINWHSMSETEKIHRLKKAFDRLIIKQDGCWDYKGSKYKKYGSINVGPYCFTINRASWIIHYGSIPENLFVCHKCDNPLCGNPDHLFLGTAKDNVKDMYQKNRQNNTCGEDSINSKLKSEQVIEIKQLLAQGISQTAIAEQFNVDNVTIHDIKYKKTWKHIT